MPTVPGRLQSEASTGTPEPLNAAAVKPVGLQAWPAGAAVNAATLDRGVHAFPPRVPI